MKVGDSHALKSLLINSIGTERPISQGPYSLGCIRSASSANTMKIYYRSILTKFILRFCPAFTQRINHQDGL